MTTLAVLTGVLGLIVGAAVGYGIAIVVLLREWAWES